ncbi:mesotocin receptor-like [Mya arenaria]|uniref:mesotocin receptor-like n=1 Tax=Mya arenaria TaxID=6604 RepID=UPI0022E356A1|nr:mesotocin receptor-like [Mya arenaria]
MGVRLPAHIAFIALSPILSTAFVVLNSFTIAIFVKKFRLASLSLVVMVNICVCDIFVCLFSNNFYLLNLLNPAYSWNTGGLACKLFKTLTMMANLNQIFSLVFLCVDRMGRFISTSSRQFKKEHGFAFLVITWVASMILSAPRMFLFDEKIITKFIPETNTSVIVNYACKPIGIEAAGYIALTVVQFIAGYAIPMVVILYCLIRCEIFIRRHMLMLSQLNLERASSVAMLNQQISQTFNMTGLLFMVIWTPFFILSILDLHVNLLGRNDLKDINFTLRCTLLVLGSGKPLIYLVSLKKFRSAFCGYFRKGSSLSSGSSKYSHSSGTAHGKGVSLSTSGM